MSTVTIGVDSLGDTQRRVSVAFRGKKQRARISFASEDLLWKTLVAPSACSLRHPKPSKSLRASQSRVFGNGVNELLIRRCLLTYGYRL